MHETHSVTDNPSALCMLLSAWSWSWRISYRLESCQCMCRFNALVKRTVKV